MQQTIATHACINSRPDSVQPAKGASDQDEVTRTSGWDVPINRRATVEVLYLDIVCFRNHLAEQV